MSTNQRAKAGRAEGPAGADRALEQPPGSLGSTGATGSTEPAAAQRMARLSFPADKDYLALARTTAMHVAGLLELPLSRVTDLRLAVDEACAAFLTAGRTGAGTGLGAGGGTDVDASAVTGAGAASGAGTGAGAAVGAGAAGTGGGASSGTAADSAASPAPADSTASVTPAADSDSSANSLELSYDLYPGRLRVSVRAPVPASWPEVDELGWTMLQALVSEVRTEVADGIGTLILVEELPNTPAPAPAPQSPPPAA